MENRSNKTALVTHIQRFSVHDGPGIRTTVFLKGCQLHCVWCHNPETIKTGPELQVMADRCIGCGACLEACAAGARTMIDGQIVYRRDLCKACGSCAEVCYAKALVLIGRETGIDEVLREVLADRDFYESSGGGVTLSGGEPLLQLAFAKELLARCVAEGIHTAIETNLMWPWERVERLLPVVDLVMADLKFFDDTLHRRYTGAPNTHVLYNLRRLAEKGMPVIIRTPLVANLSDSVEDMEQKAAFLAGLKNIQLYELLPYHPLGEGKRAGLGLKPPEFVMEAPGAERLSALLEVARKAGLNVRVAGLAAGESVESREVSRGETILLN